jgi:ribosomal protein L32
MGNFYMELRHKDETPVEKSPLKSRSITGMEERLLEVEDRVNKLLLVNAALYDVIKDKLNLTDDDIAHKIDELKKDSNFLLEQKTDQYVRKCRKCGKNLIQRRTVCVYCGMENEKI